MIDEHEHEDHPARSEGSRPSPTLESWPTLSTTKATVDRIGEYQILGVLGEGGMGVVYLAQQERPRRFVALKVIRAGVISRDLLRRFEFETEVLGRLQHPGIARIYDAGAAPGADPSGHVQPYFAMEYVRGRPMIEHCESHRLDVRSRLRLMLKVCQAVQYAHHNGVIHRDLKPGNIIMDEHDQPKILDFGVARSADVESIRATLQTDIGAIVGTVPYMSPEQIAGDPSLVSTRSDVYSLGVILYELLTGRLPHDLHGKTLPEVVQIVSQREHTRLSSMNRLFRGDLDTIVAKALEKEPRRRYASASELALDLQRYLDDQPIVARPPSAMYQFRKFAKRNRALVGAAAIVGLCLVSATVVSALYGLSEARAKRDAQRARDNEAEQRRLADDRRVEADRRAAEAIWQAYLANIAAADVGLHAHDVESARRRLMQIPPEARNQWEWAYLYSRLDDSIRKVAFRGGSSYACAFLPGGESVAVSFWDRTIKVLNPESLLVQYMATGHQARVPFLKISPSGGIAMTASDDQEGDLKIWSADLKTLHRSVGGFDGTLCSIEISPDQHTAVCGLRTGVVEVIDVSSGERLRRWQAHEREITSMVFSMDGLTLFTAGDYGIAQWNYQDGSLRARTPRGTSRIRDLRRSVDGSLLVSAWEAGDITLWNSETLEQRLSIRAHDGAVRFAAFAPDDRIIVSGGQDTTVRFWDASNGRPLGVLHGHSKDALSVAFSPISTQFVTTCLDGAVRLWDLQQAESLGLLRGHRSAVAGGSFSWDGRRFFTAAADGTVRAWDVDSGFEVASQPGATENRQPLATSPDGLTIVTTDGHGGICLRESSTLNLRLSETRHSNSVTDLAFTPDSRHIISASYDGDVHILNTSDLSIVRSFSDHADKVISAMPTSDGRRVIIVRGSSRVQCYDLHTGESIWDRSIRVPSPTTATLSPDSRQIAVGFGGGEILRFDTEQCDLVGKRMECRTAVLSLTYSPDGQRLASGGVDGVIHLWDTDLDDEVLSLRGHVYSITALEWSPDGSTLASGSFDATVRLWEVKGAADRVMARRLARPRLSKIPIADPTAETESSEPPTP